MYIIKTSLARPKLARSHENRDIGATDATGFNILIDARMYLLFPLHNCTTYMHRIQYTASPIKVFISNMEVYFHVSTSWSYDSKLQFCSRFCTEG